MAAIGTPICYLDAPEFRELRDNDAKRLAAALRKIGKIEEKKQAQDGSSAATPICQVDASTG